MNNRKKIEKDLDNLWRGAIVIRAGFKCERCGCSESKKNAHHIIPRTYKRLRWEPSNGICLCEHQCHRKAHDYPKEFEIWLEDKSPMLQESLQEIRARGISPYSLSELESVGDNLRSIVSRLNEESVDDLPF